MSAKKKAKVEYFPHFVHHGKTMLSLETKFGNDGYCLWFKLLEILGDTEHHVINCNEVSQWDYLLTKSRVDNEKATAILDLMAKLGAIDKDLWEYKIIWSQNFIDNLNDVYTRRRVELLQKSDLVRILQSSTGIMSSFNSLSRQDVALIPLSGQDVNISPYSIVNQSKPNNIITQDDGSVIDFDNPEPYPVEDDKQLFQTNYYPIGKHYDWLRENAGKPLIPPMPSIGSKCIEYINRLTELCALSNTSFDDIVELKFTSIMDKLSASKIPMNDINKALNWAIIELTKQAKAEAPVVVQPFVQEDTRKRLTMKEQQHYHGLSKEEQNIYLAEKQKIWAELT